MIVFLTITTFFALYVGPPNKRLPNGNPLLYGLWGMWGVGKRLPGGNPLLWGDGVLTILGLCLLMGYGEGVNRFVIMRKEL